VINREGIYDNASIVGAGLIRWDEINDLRQCQFINQLYLGVFPKDPDAVIARQSAWKRLMMRLHKHINAPPVNIPQGALPITISELLREIAVRFGR
jgi:hypothetical protein